MEAALARRFHWRRHSHSGIIPRKCSFDLTRIALCEESTASVKGPSDPTPLQDGYG